MMVPVLASTSQETDLSYEPGEIISDRYVIEEQIGRGGMGVVYRATDNLMNEKVALKFMKPFLLSTQKGQRLFIQEAQVARRLRHDHIVAVHDVSSTPEGIMYLSMEFIRGRSLRACLRKQRLERKFLDVRLAVALTAQILEALAYAHRTVVHRDIKPENVMLLPGERTKVLDFGLAKAIDEEAKPAAAKTAGGVIGTMAYAAPEQIDQKPVDLRADVYSTGLLLYELLTLRTPVDEYIEVTKARNDIAPALKAVVEKARKPNPDDRWQSAGEFRSRLLEAFDESYRRVAAGRRPESSGPTRGEVSTEGMAFLEGGHFVMGNNDAATERPEFEVYAEPFYMDIHPVSNAQYAEFLKATGRAAPSFWGDEAHSGPTQPVVGVTWEDAAAYAAWAGKELPTEAQWEFASRGKENRRYPWGNQEPTPMLANYADHLSVAALAGMHEEGQTPEGIQDLAGNVYEWTADLFLPYQPSGKRSPAEGAIPRYAVRGGCWNSPPDELRCSFRMGLFPQEQLDTVGFRCVLPVRTVPGS